MSGYRLASGGSLIDRDRPLSFRFDGRDYRGYQGDTLASALIASGARVVARSFKYHRPRGILSAGPEEPSALVTVGEGARATPNTKATTVELHDGLVATSQNRWPSLTVDLMAASGLFAPIFAAGFYYKTFMGPTRGAWHFYERYIRRAAGLGSIPADADPDRFDASHLFCDVLVVGAGASGLSAARAAAHAGARVVLADEGAGPGGSLMAEARSIEGAAAPDWACSTATALAALKNVRVLPRTTVWGYYDGNLLAAVERVTDHLAAPPEHLPRQRLWSIRAKEVVLATGAVDRPILFPGNDLPGVMLAEAVRRYALGYGAAAGRRIVLFGSHDGVYETALALVEAGGEVATIVDPRPTPPADLAVACGKAGIPVRPGYTVLRAIGRRGVKHIEIGRIKGAGAEIIAADVCGSSGGPMPLINLHSQAGSRPVYDAEAGMFLPGSPRERWRAAGASKGVFGLADRLADGAAAGRQAAEAAGYPTKAGPGGKSAFDRTPAPPLAIFQSPRRGKGKIFVDLQNDVTVTDIELAHREGYRSVEHLKRYTTLGMATDQGKTSNVPAIALMAELRGEPTAAVGTTTFRPPYTPVTLGAIAGRDCGAHLRPVRRTPMHEWHEANGAEMMAVGLWMRPRAYYLPGEGLEEAYVREAHMVRERVGVADVSTLGKIDVQGPDAAEFLDSVYTNMFSTLPVGKARYGLMLRDDGFVFDDGTSWRLSETRFLMTTTTANAGPVMQWLEFLLDTAWPELKVHLTSITEQWAGIAVAGPQSRQLLQRVVEDADLSNDALPHMGVCRATALGLSVMIARLSFSGELAYELYAPANHGVALWTALLEAGRPERIAPYGMEAMGALRIEKGHVTGSELDGRTTPDDLGLSGLVSKKKDFVGKAMIGREALLAPGRRQLVGLVCDEARSIPAGAQLVEPATNGPSLGHVTAATWSPALKRFIALGLLKDGRRRHGARLTAADPVRDRAVPVVVRDPHFYDPKGERMHV